MKHPAVPVDIPVCSCCGEPAVIYQPVSRRHLCGRHLIHDVEKRVASTINEAGQIHAGDRIAVGLSGGKDSTALLVILSRLLPAWPGTSLIAITVDEGIAGYRTDTIQAAEALTGRLGVDHRIVSFRDLVGADLDTLLAGRETQACTICGILRKKALTDAARAAGATAIATGHNLDDEAQSVLMNAFRGDLPRLVRNTGTGRSALFLPRIKPLAAVTEKEIAAYLFVQGLFSVLPECPYTRYALRAEVRSLLAGLEDRHPGT
ncbi:ATP-binding protein, partial [Methanoregula sp.]|uniref:ATP-binding protein n=1 Tax=Methanoregula sp. TaxID=2052170 RepID=UPI003FD872D3